MNEVGDEQHMVLQEGGNVSLWIAPQEGIVTKVIQCYDMQVKDKTKNEVIGNLKSAGVDSSVVKGKMVGYL